MISQSHFHFQWRSKHIKMERNIWSIKTTFILRILEKKTKEIFGFVTRENRKNVKLLLLPSKTQSSSYVGHIRTNVGSKSSLLALIWATSYWKTLIILLIGILFIFRIIKNIVINYNNLLMSQLWTCFIYT